MLVERSDSDALVVNKLPDGSTVIVDSKNETVFALNATAGAAWEACSAPSTLSAITERMQSSLDSSITEDFAAEAVLQLEQQKLVRTSGAQPSRRRFIATLGAAALPLVVALPVSEQRAYAQSATSAGPGNSGGTDSGSGSGSGGHSILWWILHLLGLV